MAERKSPQQGSPTDGGHLSEIMATLEAEARRHPVPGSLRVSLAWLERSAPRSQLAVKEAIAREQIAFAEREADVIVRAVIAGLDAAGLSGEPRDAALAAATEVLRVESLTDGETV